MQDFTIGAGIASLAFWGFIAAVVLGGIWYDIRRRAEQQKTIRSIVESGQQLDQKMLESILATEKADPIKTSKDMKLAAIIIFFVGVGMVIFGILVGMQDQRALFPMMGIGGLMFAIGAGLWLASQFIAKNND